MEGKADAKADDQYIDDAEFAAMMGIQLPSLDPDTEPEPAKKSGHKRTLDDRECSVEVLSSGQIMRAPMPMAQVLREEEAAGSAHGTYFVELMRRRLQGLLDVQNKWLSRACNAKHVDHVNIQSDIRNFIRDAMRQYEQQFGPASPVLAGAPIRKRPKKRTLLSD
jgi:hypothetical protein